MTDDDRKQASRRQEGNVPVIRIDEDDLEGLDSLLLGNARPGKADRSDPAGPPRLEIELDLEDDAGFEALLRRTLDEVSPGGKHVEVTGPQTSRAASGKGGQPAAARRSPPPSAGVSADTLQVKALRDQLGRMTSETESYRRRLAAEADVARRLGHEDVFKALLPIADILDGALVSGEKARDFDKLFEGLEMVVLQLRRDLRPLGLEHFDALGQPFDPTRHEALQQVQTGRAAPGTVVRVARHGYMLGDRLLRPALVIVEASDE